MLKSILIGLAILLSLIGGVFFGLVLLIQLDLLKAFAIILGILALLVFSHFIGELIREDLKRNRSDS